MKVLSKWLNLKANKGNQPTVLVPAFHFWVLWWSFCPILAAIEPLPHSTVIIKKRKAGFLVHLFVRFK